MIPIPKWLADVGLQINRLYYRQLLDRVYGPGRRSPSWFDHRIDLHCLWPENLFWLERGVWPRKYMSEGCTVLDLFCGDGFYSRYFHTTLAGHIDAVDKDPEAIAHAQRWHSHPKISYVVLDAVEQEFPQARYDVILWYEAIEHLNRDDYTAIASRIKVAIGQTGVLIGSTPLAAGAQGGKGNWEHQYEFGSIEELRVLLASDFVTVETDVTVYPTWDGGQRRTAHFAAREPR